MGFLQPWALLALPLALAPLVLTWHGRRTGEPLRFSSLYLLERARRTPARWTPTRTRWLLLLRCLIVLVLVVAAARPVAPGGGDPAAHPPTRAIVALDVSASVAQIAEGRSAWESIHAWADTLLAWAGPEDRVALATFADGIVGWWAAPPEALRRRLATLRPTGRPSDWPRAISALAGRLEEGTEAYLLTDGSRGSRPPDARSEGGPLPPGHRVVVARSAFQEPNRGLVGATWVAPGAVALAGRAWGPGAPRSAVAARLAADRVVEPRPIPLDGSVGAAAWAVRDTATFALGEGDPLSADDRLYAAAGAGGAYRVFRWAPADEPAEPGALFWEAALAALPRGAEVGRAASLPALAGRSLDLAILPIRTYRSDEAALLADLARAGALLLFTPSCADAACVPQGAWLPSAELGAPRLAWRLAPPDRRTSLLPRAEGDAARALPDPLLGRLPIRRSLAVAGGPEADWTWDLATGEAALWVRGAVAVWLVPLGPPVTRLGTTPVFPLIADAVLAAWDPEWRAGAGGIRAGEALPVPPTGATVTGPLHVGPAASRWNVAPGGAPPRPEAPGLYRIEPRGAGEVGEEGAGGVPSPGQGVIFVAVNGGPGEGDLAPIAAEVWRAAWGRPVRGDTELRVLAYPRRRGPELWPWALALALAGLAGEAALRRASSNK